jgi:hypothetical protein
MSQNINLFSPALRKPRQLLRLATVVQCLAVTLVTLVAYAGYLHQQADGARAELGTADSLLKSQRGYVNTLKDRATTKVDALLEADIARHERELKLAREAMAALKGGMIGNPQGFAEYLRAFSRQTMPGLWLTGFTIAGGGELEIRGRTLSPDLVPGYLQRLGKESALAGRSFARLEVSRPTQEPAPAGGGREVDAPRFLEFSLATRAAGPEKAP